VKTMTCVRGIRIRDHRDGFILAETALALALLLILAPVLLDLVRTLLVLLARLEELAESVGGSLISPSDPLP
jgi:hypothetical protein